MKLGKIITLSTILFLSFFLFSNSTSAISVPRTNQNYIWRTPNSDSNWFLQSQGSVSIGQDIFSGIGRQFIGRLQSSFSTNIGNLSEYTILYVDFVLITDDYSDNNPGITLPYTGWGQKPQARLNVQGATNGFCFESHRTLKQINFKCEYVFNNSNLNLSTIWLDVGNLSVENGNSPKGNDYLYVGHRFKFFSIDYSYQTGLNAGTQAIINVLNNSNSQVINQNNQIIDKLNATNKFLLDDTPPSVDISKTPSVGLLPPGVFDSIINMPLNLMNVIVSSLGGSCSSIIAPLPYVNKNLTLPCFSDTIYKGDFKTALDILSIPVVAIIFYGYFKKIKERFERAITMTTTEKDEWGIL